MEKFTKLNGIAVPMDLINIDTDMIIPKLFLKTIKRTGLGENLFDDMRYNEDRTENKDFILNDDHYRNAQIIVAGDNFGCGSSREHAPWALADFGVRCVISTSFADIFWNNCFNNSICPVIVDEESHREIMNLVKDKDSSEISVDLENRQIIAGNKIYLFEMEDSRRRRLLEGLDHIGITLQYKNEIESFEKQDKERRPWV